MKRLLMLCLVCLICISGCSKAGESANGDANEKAGTTPATEPEEQYIINEKMESEAVGKNIVDESATKDFYVLLPPSYYSSEKRYPVVYYLHGQAEGPSGFMYNSQYKITGEFNKGAKEFIFVAVDGTSNQGGAFYVNSPVSGNYEDYVVDELVAYIDGKYRTIAERDSRGICGFSMGGYGAYNLAMRHPDVYCCVLSMSPGVLADGELPIAMETWKGDSLFLTGYARAFSPIMEDENGVYGNIPVMDDSEEDKKIQKDWESGFGQVNEKLDAYVALDNPLKAIKFTYGTNDYYRWIISGCEFLAQRMDDRNIPYVMEDFPINHTFPSNVVSEHIVPFFNENLIYE